MMHMQGISRRLVALEVVESGGSSGMVMKTNRSACGLLDRPDRASFGRSSLERGKRAVTRGEQTRGLGGTILGRTSGNR